MRSRSSRVPPLVKLPLIVCAVASLGCQNPVDAAAKKRIFSPEDPPQAVAAANQKLPPEEVAQDESIARRILGMGAAETTERLGAHTYTATVTWEWTTGGKNVRLKETRQLLSGPGGVAGDFVARLSNSNEQGVEVMRVQDKVFARSTYGKDGAGRFRQRQRDRGMAERLRDEASGALRDFDSLFLGRLQLTPQGTSTFEGRTAWKYTVGLAAAHDSTTAPLPSLVTPKNGPDETTKRRQYFLEHRTPKVLQGELLVDAQTSVVLKARLDGRMAVKADEGEAELHLALDAQRSGIGKKPVIEAPKEFLPDEDKPDGVVAALERMGLSKRRADAGVDSEGDDDGD